MPLRFQVGDVFPDATLEDDRGQKVRIGELGEGQPLMVAFYRGPW